MAFSPHRPSPPGLAAKPLSSPTLIEDRKIGRRSEELQELFNRFCAHYGMSPVALAISDEGPFTALLPGGTLMLAFPSAHYLLEAGSALTPIFEAITAHDIRRRAEPMSPARDGALLDAYAEACQRNRVAEPPPLLRTDSPFASAMAVQRRGGNGEILVGGTIASFPTEEALGLVHHELGHFLDPGQHDREAAADRLAVLLSGQARPVILGLARFHAERAEQIAEQEASSEPVERLRASLGDLTAGGLEPGTHGTLEQRIARMQAVEPTERGHLDQLIERRNALVGERSR